MHLAVGSLLRLSDASAPEHTTQRHPILPVQVFGNLGHALSSLGSDFLGDATLLLFETRGKSHALAARLLESHVAPVERRLLAVVLSEGASGRRLHQFLAEIERVCRLIDPELVEDLVEVR